MGGKKKLPSDVALRKYEQSLRDAEDQQRLSSPRLKPCNHCGYPIYLRQTRDGWRPFNPDNTQHAKWLCRGGHAPMTQKDQ